ncbi:hypothetical protein AGMMS49982_01700 [Bacteroidia bacterium]|nr:hypothetical protein AGMMS49982_01700 [Bacteroidia bacterium]
MQAYKYDTKISEAGIISLPYEPQLFNMDVEVIIVPKAQPIQRKQTAVEHFLETWSGAFKDMTDEELDNAKYKYLKEKHK